MTAYPAPVDTRSMTPLAMAATIWVLTSFVFSLGWLVYLITLPETTDLIIVLPVFICSAVITSPVLLILLAVLPEIKDSYRYPVAKIKRLLRVCYLCTIPYSLIGAIYFSANDKNDSYEMHYMLYALAISACLFACAIVALLITGSAIMRFFAEGNPGSVAIWRQEIKLQGEL